MVSSFLKFFGYGWLVLAIAIIVNGLVRAMGVTTWYDYITEIGSIGLFSATAALHIANVLFLFLIYPAIFGLIVWLAVARSQRN